MVNFAAEDAEIAVVLGHELAHLVTDSEAQRARPPARTGTRQREARADRVGLRLAACAGYDPAAAAHFWQRYAASRWIDVLGNLGHPSSRTRARDLAAEAQQLRQSSDAGCGPELVD
jgi:predicted Zn-dependent protease